MNIKQLIYMAIFFISLVFCLSDAELKAIEENIDDVIIAPDFQLSSIKSNVLDSLELAYLEEDVILSALKGKVVLLNFWATWCGPCRLEIPDLNDLYKEYHDKGLEILGISTSDGKQQLVNFKKAYNITYPLLYGSPMVMNEITTNYGGIYSIPTSILINKNNEILRIYPGAILKQYDPNMYADLLLHIKQELEVEYIIPELK